MNRSGSSEREAFENFNNPTDLRLPAERISITVSTNKKLLVGSCRHCMNVLITLGIGVSLGNKEEAEVSIAVLYRGTSVPIQQLLRYLTEENPIKNITTSAVLIRARGGRRRRAADLESVRDNILEGQTSRRTIKESTPPMDIRNLKRNASAFMASWDRIGRLIEWNRVDGREGEETTATLTHWAKSNSKSN
ncbi:hypothetical protein EVAR_61339_1 [Eumeta japonica]|uniref:Uncharacterized protein n=1 Tax=Eumeta variegata TaxID=151549 RepID=A0A4C1Y3K9_EUMVA|nr:hypothetical protein EVAR_61339_1 [Eumeta japonica]